MGLRINSIPLAQTALRGLRNADRLQSRSLERLATGLRINRASDDPSGLVISSQLRAQIAALNQAVTNSQNGSNLIATADAALQEVSDLLIAIQDSILFAQNTATATPTQIAAEQSSLDQALAAIDRIAQTTRFGDRALLNGTAANQLISTRPDDLQNLNVRSVSFNQGETQRSLNVTVEQVPLRGRIRFDTVSSITTGTILRITGSRGTADITLGTAVGAAAASGIANGINTNAGTTGVFASASGQSVNLLSEDFGVAQSVRIELIAGNISGGGAAGQVLQVETNTGNLGTLSSTGAGAILSSGEVAFDTGRDARVSFDGTAFSGVGNTLSISTRAAQFTFTLDPDQIAFATSGVGGTISAGTQANFTIANTGLTFQLNELPRQSDRLDLGIESVLTLSLGIEATRDRIAESIAGISSGATTGQLFEGGFLNSAKSGGANDLTNNPQNAGVIVQAAIDQVSRLRGFLGAVEANTIRPNINSVEIHIENLSASLSLIRDLDFAAETAAFTRSQILFQAGIITLASANLIPQAVLSLLE